MNDPAKHAPEGLISLFTWRQKAVVRAGFFLPPIVGAAAIMPQSPWGAVMYAAAAALAFMFGVLPHLCAHCPYPYKHGDCLALPPGAVTGWLRYRGPEMTTADSLITAASILVVLAAPQYWLWPRPWLLALFWALAAPSLVIFPLHLCARCRHTGCPLNRARWEGSISPDELAES